MPTFVVIAPTEYRDAFIEVLAAVEGLEGKELKTLPLTQVRYQPVFSLSLATHVGGSIEVAMNQSESPLISFACDDFEHMASVAANIFFKHGFVVFPKAGPKPVQDKMIILKIENCSIRLAFHAKVMP